MQVAMFMQRKLNKFFNMFLFYFESLQKRHELFLYRANLTLL